MGKVLKVENRRANFKLVGASLPPQVHNYISLYTVAKGLNKTSIMKELFENWMKQQKIKGASETALMDLIEKRARIQWQITKTDKTTTFADFKRILINELGRKGVSEDHINTILQKINDKWKEKE